MDQLVMTMNNKKEFDENLLRHFINPHNVGTIDQADASVRIHNPVNGYTTDLYLSIKNNKIIDARFKTYGCTVTIATGSAITTILKGKHIDDITSADNPIDFLEQELKKELGEVPEKNWHCIPTVVKAVFLALIAYFEKQHNITLTNTLQDLVDTITINIETKIHDL